MANHLPAARSHLPHFLALLYALAIVFASLQPFSPWVAPEPGTRYFLAAPWPQYWTRFDVIANVVAYVPFGLFLGLIPRRQTAARQLAAAIAGGAALSLAMETAQMYLPPRDASTLDLLSNTAGVAAGGILAVLLARSVRTRRAIVAFRDRGFLPGKVGDMGLALMVIWLAVQVNPGIPLFAVTFDPSFRTDPAADILARATTPDVVTVIVESAGSAFQLLGVGLFLALLLRERRHIGGALLGLILTALLVKGIAASTLLKPAVWERWLTPGISTGVAVGALLLLAAIWLPRPAQVAIATVALLSSLLTMVLAPDLLFARAPLSAFNWSYGHLLNFNGLTHIVLLVWPLAASAFLFALAGRPGWGESG
jgi:VanZ family protein